MADRAGPDLEGLATFAVRGDRRRALFFVGREAETGAVECICAKALAEARSGEPFEGATQLVQGAPGAGKSSLLAELGRRWMEAAGRAGGVGPVLGTPLPVVVEWDTLLSEQETARAILKASDEDAEARSRRTMSRGASGGVAAGPFRAAFRTGSSTAPETLSFARLRDMMPEGGWTRPVCIMIDEIQQAHAGVLPVLNRLHQGNHGLPLVPLLAGLGSSYSHLDVEIGLTRLSSGATHDIGALAPEEAQEAVMRMLAAYRVDCSRADPEAWAAWLADVSDAWPQHLHNGMAALAGGLAAAGGRLAAVDADAVAAREETRRRTAYERRVSPQMARSAFLVAAVMDGLPEGGATDIAILGAIERAAADEPGWRLPEDMTAERFLDHLVHRGALQRGVGADPKSLYSCPIPSLRDHLVRGGSGPQAGPGSPAPPDGGLPEP